MVTFLTWQPVSVLINVLVEMTLEDVVTLIEFKFWLVPPMGVIGIQ